MNGKLWDEPVVHEAPDGERTFLSGETDEIKRAKQRDQRHAAEAARQTTPASDEPQPIVVNAK